jgi:hypothetical protein
MIITDVFPVIVKIVKIIKYCTVLFAVVEFAKGFVSEAESTDPADLDVTTESSGQCADFHQRTSQSSNNKEESSSVLATIEKRRAKCREVVLEASKRGYRWRRKMTKMEKKRFKGWRREMRRERRNMIVETRLEDPFTSLCNACDKMHRYFEEKMHRNNGRYMDWEEKELLKNSGAVLSRNTRGGKRDQSQPVFVIDLIIVVRF